MLYRLEFLLEFMNDYHVSAAVGDGANCDALLLRDANGWPAIMGTTFCGLLRDATEKMDSMSAIPFLEQGDIERIFGSARDEKNIIVSRGVCVKDSNDRLDKYQNSQVNKRSKRSQITRTVQPGMLYAREEGEKHIFAFQVDCSSLCDASLITAAARFVRSLGTGKRRGLGECLLTLSVCRNTVNDTEYGQNEMMEFFRSYWMEGKELPEFLQQTRFTAVSEVDCDNAHAVRIRLVIKADSPLLISNRSLTGNEFASLDYIPGSVLRGSLASRIFAKGSRQSEDIEQYERFIHAVVRGGILWAALYPLDEHSTGLRYAPTIPTPFDILACKEKSPLEKAGSKHDVVSLLVDGVFGECKKCGAELKNPGGFLVLGNKPQVHKKKTSIEMHNRICLETGQVEQTGGLYSYHLLQEGQFFGGEMRCSSKTIWQQFCSMAGLPEEGKEFTLYIGKGRKRGYGKVTAVWEECADEKPDLWIGLDFEQRLQKDDSSILVTLLTDAIFQDAWGRYAEGLDCWQADGDEAGEEECRQYLLECAFGEAVPESLRNALPRIKHIQSYGYARAIDGFNTHHGVPRVRDRAIVAGTSAKVLFSSPLDKNALAALRHIELWGVGFRRSEGFGKVAFNLPLYKPWKDELTGEDIPLPSPFVKEQEDIVAPRTLQKDLFKSIERAVAAGWRRVSKDKSFNECLDKYATAFEGLSRWLLTIQVDSVEAARDEVNKLCVDKIETCERKLWVENKSGSIDENTFLEEALENTDKTGFYKHEDKGNRMFAWMKYMLKEVPAQSFWQSGVNDELKKEAVDELLRQLARQIAVAARCARNKKG